MSNAVHALTRRVRHLHLPFSRLLPGLVLLAVAALGVAWWRASAPPDERSPFGAGVCLSYGPSAAHEVATLGARWYVDWSFTTPDVPGYRRLYVVRPGASLRKLAQVAATKRGGWWAIGNEPNDPNQDNQTPQAYARFFRAAAATIRGADRQAHILSAGLANADWRWAAEFRQAYGDLTGADPRLDGWNIHDYLLDDGQDQYDVDAFKQRILAFRYWMNQIGDGQKPLLLTEFGVLYGAGCCHKPVDPPAWGVTFMEDTVTWLASGDLVQGWAWFMTQSGDSQFNGDLFSASGRLSPFGQAYQQLNLAAP